jgi:spermidine synthase
MSRTADQRKIIDWRVTVSGEVQLQQRAPADGSPAFEIISDGVFLMASYSQTSERTLARQAIEAVKPEQDNEFRILVGGLGMGFTLQECLVCAVDLGYAASDIQVDVVEISDAIVEWNHTHLASMNGQALDHPSVQLIQTDLYDVLMESTTSIYDAIVLDVDNGPSWLAQEQNGRLYSEEALVCWGNILKPGAC